VRNGILIFKFNFFPNVVMVHLSQALFFSPAKVARARERAAALEKVESQQKRTAADRKMQQAIAREKKARETAKRKARKKIERITAREETVHEKAIR
jgi:hypothetical protein